ncbi:hypothetical protein NG751_08980 [Aliarcobacter cryaerophilus]|uniref:hypothetical protein n=1 Tax=Aliarcobacter cryaerophilus TaxID=28198 RepID=UPI003DA3F4AE
MNDFSMLDEIEKYLLEIFGDKINALENKQIFYEKVLKKSDQFEGEEKIFFQIKVFLKNMFDFKNIIDNELYKKEFMEFSKRYSITRIEFENIFESAKIKNEKEYYDSPAIKKIVLEIKGELPTITARVYNINLVLFTKVNGGKLSLKEYSSLTGEDYITLKKILKNA